MLLAETGKNVWYLTGAEFSQQARGDKINTFKDRVMNIPYLVLDEAYDEYLTEEHKSIAFSWLSNFENLIISRSFSKAYGLAGLRVGFGAGSSYLIEIMNSIWHNKPQSPPLMMITLFN